MAAPVELDKGDPKKIFQSLVKIAEGSYGDVYKDCRSGATVAYKLIQGILKEERDEVLQEVAILQKCSHQNIISLVGAWSTQPNELVIALEYCDGGAASDLYTMPEALIKLIMRETLKALSYLHTIPVIHRDIKGGNILITGAGAIKLTDFGVSAVLKNANDKRLELIGTPYWIAPEVAMVNLCGVPYGLKADVWSVGITAIELAETRPPLHGVEISKAIAEIPNLLSHMHDFVIAVYAYIDWMRSDSPLSHPCSCSMLIFIRRDVPKLLARSKWSEPFHSFLTLCLVKDPAKRPGPVVLLSHGWLQNGIASASDLAAYVAQAIAASKPAPVEAPPMRRRETKSVLTEVAARQRRESNAGELEQQSSAPPRPVFNLAELSAAPTSGTPPPGPSTLEGRAVSPNPFSAVPRRVAPPANGVGSKSNSPARAAVPPLSVSPARHIPPPPLSTSPAPSPQRAALGRSSPTLLTSSPSSSPARGIVSGSPLPRPASARTDASSPAIGMPISDPPSPRPGRSKEVSAVAAAAALGNPPSPRGNPKTTPPYPVSAARPIPEQQQGNNFVIPLSPRTNAIKSENYSGPPSPRSGNGAAQSANPPSPRPSAKNSTSPMRAAFATARPSASVVATSPSDHSASINATVRPISPRPGRGLGPLRVNHTSPSPLPSPSSSSFSSSAYSGPQSARAVLMGNNSNAPAASDERRQRAIAVLNRPQQ